MITSALTFLVLFTLSLTAQVKPDSFERHKVKKKETLYGLARKYNVQIEQIEQYNPLIKKIGLKKRMILQSEVRLMRAHFHRGYDSLSL